MPDFGRWTAGGGDPSLNEINRADRFFEALAAKQPAFSTDPEEAELAFLLSDWRDDVRDAPITAPVSPRDAIEALHGGLAKNRGPRRSFAVVGSMAAAMLCIGGFGTAVFGAGPGDSLYGVRTAIFGQQEVTRDDGVSLASAQLQQVQQLIDNGQWQEAQDKLVAVSTTVQDVGQVEQKQQLVEQWNALTYKVVEQDSAATLPPGEPLPVLSSSPLTWLPVPVVEATTTESATTSESGTTSESTTTSETVVTSPSDSSVSSGSPLTPSSDGSTPGSSATATSPSATVPPAGTSSSTSAPAPPSQTGATTSSPPSSTTTTTATTTVPQQSGAATQQSSTAAVPPPVVRSTSTVAELPAPPPRVAPSPPVAPAPPKPSQTATSTAPAQRPSAEPTTTTVVPPS